jgi:hypothetical protein
LCAFSWQRIWWKAFSSWSHWFKLVAGGGDEEVMEHKEKGKAGEALGVEQNKTWASSTSASPQ